jgi:hypothetical protein
MRQFLDARQMPLRLTRSRTGLAALAAGKVNLVLSRGRKH